MTFRSIAAAAGFAALTLVSACGEAAPPPQADGRIAVVTSTEVWASVVTAVGGDRVSVTSVIKGSTGDPHGYEAKPADVVPFDGAKLVVSNGGGYDDFFPGLADRAAGKPRRIVAAEIEHTDAKSAPAEGGHDHANEHVWYDFETVHGVAEKIAEELSAIAPEHKDQFKANAEAFGAKLDALNAKVDGIGKSGVKVLATEPVAGLLLAHAGLTDATPEEFAEAVEEENDPPASAIAATQALIDDKQVAALIYNEQTETPVTKSIKDKAVAAGIPIVTMTETFPDGVTDYVVWMTEQVDSLAGALAAA